MKTKNFFRVLCLLLVLGFAPIISQGQTELGYKLKVDDLFRIKQQANQLIIQEMEGAKHELTNDLEAIFSFKVVALEDSNFVVELAFEDFGMKTTSNLQGELINVKASEPVAGDIMSELFSGLIGFKLKMIMQGDGKIIAVDGGNEMVENMITQAKIEDEFTKKLMRASLEKEFSSDGLAKSFEQMTFFYPTQKVSTGESWNNEFEGKLKAKNTWNLQALTKDTASIQGNATITMETDEGGTVMNLTGNQSTTIVANSGNGFIRSIKSESSAEGVSKIASLGNVEIPTKIISTITYESIQ